MWGIYMSISADSNNIQLDTARHSFAHLMAAAVQDLFPEAMFGVGPVIDTGCYYDFILPRVLIPEDLELIERKVKSFLQKPLEYKTEAMSYDQARELFLKRGQGLKVELINDIETKSNLDSTESLGTDDGVTIWRIVDSSNGEMLFEDLCKGPHIEDIKELRKLGFKIDKMSSVYWRADASRESMQRVYALVMQNQEDLASYIFAREEAKKRDHRVLNQTLKYYTISELVGAGLPLIQPNGMILRECIQDYLWQIHKIAGYQKVWTPHIAKIDLYEKSGHASKFGDELFKVKGKTDEFIMKPMNCPHHMQIFADNQFSYKDMPIRYFEHATVYRDEKPGQLSGFTRVRAITQDDGHLFCRTSQIKSEVSSIVAIIKSFYDVLDFESSWVSLSVRDSSDLNKYLGESNVWDDAENALEQAAIANGLNYKRVEGEAAFYGPKLDFMFKDCMGREWQLATIQLDFNLPERFDLNYINESGEKERPVVIHRAISGSSERFLGVLIDNYGGKFPFWLAPTQVKVLTINDEVIPFVDRLKTELSTVILNKPLKYNELRFEVDTRAESLGKKIREAKLLKVPVLIIVGPKDVENNEVSVRIGDEESKVRLSEIASFLTNL
jgi:threonyl-tRNA synthetase